MDRCKTVNTPMCVQFENGDDRPCDSARYREIIGALLYLSTRTRPDITAAVSILSRHVSQPTNSHMTALKRVLRYLRGTTTHGIHLGGTNKELVVYADANWGGDSFDRKSTSGHLIQFGGTTISWKTSKQKLVALSSTEAEFVAASDACKELCWIHKLSEELGEPAQKPTTLYRDNQGALKWETVGVRNAKHISIRKNFVLEKVLSGEVEVQYCPSSDMVADVLTKPLMRELHNHHVRAMRVLDCNLPRQE